VPKELRGTRYRHLVIPPLRVFYRREGGKIYIVYIMRSEKFFDAHILSEREGE
jgi:hypothetical protein